MLSSYSTPMQESAAQAAAEEASRRLLEAHYLDVKRKQEEAQAAEQARKAAEKARRAEQAKILGKGRQKLTFSLFGSK